MNIEVLSLSKKLNKNDKTECYKQLSPASDGEDINVNAYPVFDFIPFIQSKMKKSAKSSPDFIVIANAFECDDEDAFKRKFAGIIYRGEREIQERPKMPKKSAADIINGIIATLRLVPKRLKGFSFDKLKKYIKRRREREIPQIPYNKKKTQVLKIEDEESQKTAYTFSYMNTKVLVLPIGTGSDEILPLIQKSQQKFDETSEEFENGYRLIPKTFRVLTFSQRHFPQRFDSSQEKIRKSAYILAFCVFIVAGCMFAYNMFVLPMQNSALQSEIQTIFHENDSGSSTTSSETKKNWKKLKKINSDIKGWIQIDNTQIDYPILQCSDDDADSQFYLTHNYKKEYSSYGAIFIDYRSKKGMNSKNVVIHGHHMDDGSMFANLVKYGDRSGGNLDFYKSSPTVEISTPSNGTETYKIISIFKSNVDPSQGEYFDFYCGSFKSDAQFMNYVYNLRIRSLINCPVSVNEDDKLITLVTCSYEFNNFRTIVVARKCREGESTQVDVSKASINSSAVWPQCYYTRNGGTRPTISTFKAEYKKGNIDWYDGDFNLKGSEELPTTVKETTEPTTTKATEKSKTSSNSKKTSKTKAKVKKYTVRIYNRGKLIKTTKVKAGSKVKLPKISKTYKKNGYKYTFKKWVCKKGKSIKKATSNMKIVATYKKTKIKTSSTKSTTKATQKATTKPTSTTSSTEATAEATEAGEDSD